jgi:tRNA threonylcarbamoyladenosine biosynthesis protein TsaB
MLKEKLRGREARLTDQDYNSNEPLILALDTSSKLTGIALSRGQEALKSVTILSDEKRSEKLWVDIESLLAESAVTINDISLFAVCVGPGSFTGLRVGMSAMKGLAAATGKPLIGVTSLEAAASQAKPSDVVCAFVNSYKGEVYSQLFSIDEDGVPVALDPPLVSTLSDALKRAEGHPGVVFTGSASLDNAGLIESASGGKIERGSSQSLAVDIARLSYLKSTRGETETAESLRACYVRPAEAEVKLSLGLLGSKIKRSLKSG